jgi:outer membrane protein
MQVNFLKTPVPYVIILATLTLPWVCWAQDSSDSTLQTATLDSVVVYALIHQPVIQQAKIDEEITNQIIRGKLADWYPQINFAYNYQRYIDLQSAVIGGNVIRFGVNNTSSFQFTGSMNLFNRDVLLASRTASSVRKQAVQYTSRSKIDVAVNVSKAFYDVLATAQQIKVSEESIVRLERSLRDAYNRYTAGVADKTDYKRATIQLGNAQAALKSNTELLKYKKEYLKTLMGYPLDQELPIEYDTLRMENDIFIDTLQDINYFRHIDYRILQTQRELQEANLRYSKWAFLPSLSASGAYNLNYQNDSFHELYDKRYPYSYVGASLTFPIFQGSKRNAEIKQEKWAAYRIDQELINLRNNLSTEYTRALASYKSNLATYEAQKENVTLAEEVYDVIQRQYQSGIRTYLDVIIAETDLSTTRINYFNALYQVLVSKLDVQRALGQINY